MLSEMGDVVGAALEAFGWDMPLDQACWCTTAADTLPGRLVVRESAVKRQPRAVGFKALGTQITFNGRCGVEIEQRLGKSWAAFYSMKHLLLCHSASITARIKL